MTKQQDPEQSDNPALAIVGIGCLFPKAGDASTYWTNIREGVDAISEVPASHWDPQDYFDPDQDAPDMTYARRGGFIDAVDFDPLRYGLSPNNLEATDSTQLLGMVVARQALLDAGYATGKDSADGRPFDRERTSVILGVTGTLELVIPLGARLGHPLWRKALAAAGVDEATATEVVQRIAQGYVPWQENSFPGLLGNVAAGRIANRFDLGGTNCVVDAACASSLSAVHMAALELYSGRADMAITGGFDTFNDIFMYMCFSKTPALSPSGNSRPFDHKGDGTILGEGLGAIILKRLDDARRDGDKVYALIRGIGASSDGRGNAIYAPSAEGQMRALKNAYSAAGVSPASIELVEAHGTGTARGDAVEAQALSAVYREARTDGSWCALGSVKSMIGHTKAAAGVAGLIKVALALQNKVLPPTIKVERPLSLLAPGKESDQESSQESGKKSDQAPVYVNASKRPWIGDRTQPRRAALSAFGFGGSNFHCVLEEAEALKPQIEWDGKVLLFAFSAADKATLAKYLQDSQAASNWAQLRAAAARSLAAFSPSDAQRLLLVITPATQREKLTVDALRLLQEDKTSWRTPEGAYYGCGGAGKLAVLFPGQGSQYCNMLLDLACQFPQMQQALLEADQSFAASHKGQRLSDMIYPIAAFSETARQRDEARLRATQHAQPGIAVCSLGAWQLVRHFGLNADMVAGHSFGELSALYAADRISARDLMRLALRRGELMQGCANGDGSMAAVAAPAQVVQEFLAAEQVELVIANHNAPAQVVLSGASSEIERALALLEKRGLPAQRLALAAAFHSSQVAAAQAPFAAFLQDIEFSAGAMPVFANSTAAPYPAAATEARALLAGQLAQPVKFLKQIENMYAAGARSFVEIGPGKVLSGLVQAILAGKDHHVMALDASRGGCGQRDLAALLAQLAALGQPLALAHWDADYLNTYKEADNKAGLLIPIGGANYVKPRAPQPKTANTPASTEKDTMPQSTTAQTIAHTTAPTAPEDARPDAPSVPGAEQPGPEQTGAADDTLLQIAQENILALQKMQAQTARLHQQYLAGQAAAQRSVQQLIDQQQQIFSAAPAPQSQDRGPASPAPVVPETSPSMHHEDRRAASPAPVVPEASPSIAPVQAAAAQTQAPGYESLLLEVVADKTGYPVEMLSMDMSLDTDLGIDSIKRVEILSALQERLPGMQKIQPEELGTFQLLQHIVEFLASDDGPAQDHAQDHVQHPMQGHKQDDTPRPARQHPPEHASTAGGTQAPGAAANLAAALLEVVADKTGYPVEMLHLAMHLDSDLGIDSIKRVEILSALQERLPEAPVVNPEDLAKLQTLQQIVDFMQATDAAPLADAKPTAEEAAPTTEPPAAKPPGAAPNLAAALLEVVADKTGYPVEMLSMDMSLDSDLGIDSIKRVEILSALQERLPEAPVVNPEELAKLQTLQQIVDFMQSADAAPLAEAAPTTEPPVHAAQATPVCTGRQPAEQMQELYRGLLDLAPIDESGAQLTLPENALLWVTDDGSALPKKICAALAKHKLRGQVVPLTARPTQALAGLLVLAPTDADDDFLQAALSLVQSCGETLQKAASEQAALLASITRLGGRFAVQDLSAANPQAGGLAGLIKTAAKEWPQLHCRALDIEAHRSSAALAASITDAVLRSGPPEVGIVEAACYAPCLRPAPLPVASDDAKPFAAGDVLVLSGGARGVTAEVAVTLARRFQVNLLLLGRTQLPEAEPAWLSGLHEEAAIKQAMLAHSGAQKSPRKLEDDYRRILAGRELLATLARIRDTGVEVMYEAVDLRAADAVAAALDRGRAALGPIAGVIHGAGVLADALISEQSRAQFQQVYSTKVVGLRALLAATAEDALKALVLFSSSTARFGRKGQAAYAIANEVLNKMAQQQQARRPQCRVVSVNWGPWDGGMVTPPLKKLFKSEGVELIPLSAGADYLMQEIAQDGPVEVVVLGAAPGTELSAQQTPPERRTAAGALSLAFERSLDLAAHPVLADHVMNGRAVLPAALTMEWLAHGAIHNNPDLSFVGIRDLAILKGVVLEDEAAVALQIMAGQVIGSDAGQRVQVELRSGHTLHARAEVLLAGRYPQTSHVADSAADIKGRYPYQSGEYYQNGNGNGQLFHGQALQGITAIDACSEQGISGRAKAAPPPTQWMARPVRSAWLADPLILDSAFQMMILWSFQHGGCGCLPSALGEYRQFQRSFPQQGVTINIRIKEKARHAATATVEFLDKNGQLVASIEEYKCVINASLNEAFKRKTLALQDA